MKNNNYHLKSDFSLNKFLFGLFLLLYSTYAYAIYGDLLKYIVLFTGIFFMALSIKISNIFKYNPFFAFRSIFFFFLFILISFLLNQGTFAPLYIAFDFICLIIFFIGFLVGKQDCENIIFDNPKLKIIMALLIMVGAYFIFKLQSIILVNETTRSLIDNNLNSNGIAYIVAQYILLMLWFLNGENNKIVKWFLILSIITLIFNLLYTESRGAFLFLIITLIITYNKKLLNLKNIILYFLLFYLSFLLFENDDFFQEKISNFILRFESFTSILDNKINLDASAKERLEMHTFFYNNYDKMLFGQLNYKPYPHNMFIEIFMRWGFFGLPLFFITLITLFNYVKIRLSIININYSLLTFILSLFFFTYIQSMSSLNLENNRLIWLGFGFLISFKINKK